MTSPLLAVLCVLAADPQPATRNDDLPPLARALLRKRMQGHAREQVRLARAVTLLQRDTVKAIAEDIAAEPRVVRPLPTSRDELNTALPEQFFVFQDAVRLRAKDLGNATMQPDDVKLAAAYGQLVQACVSCHSVFLVPE
ncbi:MAG: hypothetical protein ACO1OB_22475 [Archangium sp.]